MHRHTLRILALAALLALTAAILSGCSAKTPLTGAGFRQKMEAGGLTVTEVTEQYADQGTVTEGYTAAAGNGAYEIDFFCFRSEADAKTMYSMNKEKFLSEKSGVSTSKETDLSNYSRYALSSNGLFMLVSRIDSTVVYVHADSEQKDAVLASLEGTDY